MADWKYPTIVELWQMENGIADIGDDIILTGATTVPGLLDNAQSFIANDYGTVSGAIASLTSVSKGTVAGIVNLGSDTAGYEAFISCSKATGTGATDHRLEIGANWSGGNNWLEISVVIGGAFTLITHTPIDSLTPFIGSDLIYEIEHDGTQIIRIQLDGSDVTLTRQVTADETTWLSDVISAGADTFLIGSLFQNSSRKHFLDGYLDQTMINSELWDSDDRAAFYNGGASQIITAPSGRQRFIGKRPILTVDKQIIGNRGNPIIR